MSKLSILLWYHLRYLQASKGGCRKRLCLLCLFFCCAMLIGCDHCAGSKGLNWKWDEKCFWLIYLWLWLDFSSSSHVATSSDIPDCFVFPTGGLCLLYRIALWTHRYGIDFSPFDFVHIAVASIPCFTSPPWRTVELLFCYLFVGIYPPPPGSLLSTAVRAGVLLCLKIYRWVVW